MKLICGTVIAQPQRAKTLRCVVGCCENIRRLREKSRRGRFPLKDRPLLAQQLRGWRTYAKKLFSELPEAGTPGCCECVFTFESIRIK